MTTTDYVDRGEFEALQRAVRDLQTQTPFESASISNGRLRFIGGLLRVDSGGRVQIVGTLEVDGATRVTGVFDVEGPWEMSGNGDITGNVSIAGDVTATGEWTQIGDWHLNGDGSITGDVDITGILTLLSELIVSSLGKITVGNMVINPANGGSVEFPGGAALTADPSGGIRIVQGANRVYVGSGLVSMQMGARSISISASGITMTGVPTILSSLAGGADPGVVWMEPGGQVFRVVAG